MRTGTEKVPGRRFKTRAAAPDGATSKPMPLPATRSEWKPGTLYIGKGGKVGKWKGTSFEVQ